MNEEQIRATVIEVIRSIAPEVDAGELNAATPLRDQIDLDSMDWLNVILGFHQRFGVDIPETDYRRLTSLDAVVAYLKAKLA